MKILPILLFVISLLVTFRVLLKKGDNGYYESIQKFKKKELKANSTIKKMSEINLDFIVPNKEKLPFKNTYNDKNIIRKQEIVKRKLNLEMVKLPRNISNTDMKELVGVNNFSKISRFEDQYNGYIRALFEWGQVLFEKEFYNEAESVLLEGLRLEANISEIYILLAKIYSKDNMKLIKLKESVEKIDIDLKQRVLSEIEYNINH